jgi:predicted amidohydrolase YtcJ
MLSPTPSPATGTEPVADTVYTNGRIYTVTEDKPWAEAVAIIDGKFVAVGSEADVEAANGDRTAGIDLGGALRLGTTSAAFGIS